VSRLVLLAVLAPLLILMGRSLERAALEAGWGPVGGLPVWAQTVTVLVAGDFIGYWAHRWFHGPRLWRFHAVHHSSEEVDWLSSVRLHPINDIGGRLLRAVPFAVLGFSPTVIAAYIPFLTFHALLLHANVKWTFGPLRYVISSPVFHRWHHSSELEAVGKNFSGLFPVWDVLFGTFYMPARQQPLTFGAPQAEVPEGFWS
jgi:sterol desaturase/sphingolipid hydroxylase (fatty acid hydroxylase superfamily)